MRVIELEPADTFPAIRDRLLLAESGRVALIVPPRGAALRRGVDLVLLRRLADRERLEVGLVTADRLLARRARALGLPTFASVTLAEHYRPGWWRRRRRELVGFAPGDDRRSPAAVDAEWAADPLRLRRRRLSRLILLFTAILLLGLLAGAVLAAVPRATITLTPQRAPVQVISRITADPALAEVDAAASAVPARPVQVTQSWAAEAAAPDTATNRQRLRAQALQGLGNAAPAILSARLAPGERLAPGSARFNVLDEAFATAGDTLQLTVSATLDGLAVDEAAVNALLYRDLSAALPDGATPRPTSLRTAIESLPGDGRTFQATAQAEGETRIDAARLRDLMRGQRTADAAAYLGDALALDGPPRIAVQPDWWARLTGRLPYRAGQIRVDVRP